MDPQATSTEKGREEKTPAEKFGPCLDADVAEGSSSQGESRNERARSVVDRNINITRVELCDHRASSDEERKHLKRSLKENMTAEDN